MEISKTNPPEEMSKTGRGTFLKEVRCAVRFPLSLPVEMADDKLHDHPAVTRNVSANGVLLELTGPTQRRRGARFPSPHARKCAWHSPRCVSSLSWTCGTLLHKPKSLSGCCYYR